MVVRNKNSRLQSTRIQRCKEKEFKIVKDENTCVYGTKIQDCKERQFKE